MMRITEVLLSEVAEPGDPGPRSTRPEWLGIAVYLRVRGDGDRYAGGAAATLPRGTQSPWNTAATARALEEAARALAGVSLDVHNPLECAGEIAGRFHDTVAPAASTSRQRTALAAVAGAVETGLLDVIARVRGVGLAAMLGARREALPRSDRTVQEATGVPTIYDGAADEAAETPDDVIGLLQDGPVQAVSVDLRRGIVAALRIVERAVAADPAVIVTLSSPGRVTDLEAAATDAVARALPKLDRYLPGRIAVVLGDAADDEQPGAAPAGLDKRPSLARIVAWMGRAARGRLGPDPEPAGTTAEVNTFDATGLETLGKNSLDSYLLEKEARRLGLATVRFRGVDFHAQDAAGHSIGFHCTTGPSTSRLVAKICGQKEVTRAYLVRAGVAVPRGQLFAAADGPAALEFAGALGWPVVVKPPEGKGGSGVISNITGADRFRRAFSGLRDDGYEQVIVEEHITGMDYRFLVIGDEVVSVLSRYPGGVTGDGRSTVAELVLAKNLVRQRNPHLRSRLLTLGPEAVNLLTARGMTPESVLPQGEHVSLTTAGNISRGGESVEVLAETHPSLLDLAVRAVRAIPGLDHAGVDLLAEDHRRPLEGQAAGVCELNSLPATSSHHFPALGPARNVSRALVGFYAGRHGLVTAVQPDPLAVRIRVTGRLQAAGYRQWFAGLAGPLGLSGWIRGGAEPGGAEPGVVEPGVVEPGVVEAAVSGSLDLVSAVALQAIFGPPGARVELVETRVVSESLPAGFTLER